MIKFQIFTIKYNKKENVKVLYQISLLNKTTLDYEREKLFTKILNFFPMLKSEKMWRIEKLQVKLWDFSFLIIYVY